MSLEKRCLGFECETAKNCKHYMRKSHPHDVMFMPTVNGHNCNTYEPLREDPHDDND